MSTLNLSCNYSLEIISFMLPTNIYGWLKQIHAPLKEAASVKFAKLPVPVLHL